MHRLISTSLLFLVFATVQSALFATPASAEPVRVTFEMGATDLFPKTTKRLRSYRRAMARLDREHREAYAAGDGRLMQRIEDKYYAIRAKAEKAYGKLSRVRGVTTLTIYGDAQSRLDRDFLAAFLRKNRDLQGTVLHVYIRGDDVYFGEAPPTRYDGQASTKSTRRKSRRKQSTGGGGGRASGTDYDVGDVSLFDIR